MNLVLQGLIGFVVWALLVPFSIRLLGGLLVRLYAKRKQANGKRD